MPTSVFGFQYQNSRMECPACGRTFEAQTWSMINAAEQPELKRHVLRGDLTQYKCLHCKATFRKETNRLYYDPENKFIVVVHPKKLLLYTERYISSLFGPLPEHYPGFQLRVVANHKELTEKVVIFDYHLDDRVMQLLKDLILRDQKHNNLPCPTEIIFSGIDTNFRQSTFQFNVMVDGQAQTLLWKSRDYDYCASLFNKYSEDFQRKGWLVVNTYFPEKFLQIAYDKYRQESYRLLISKSDQLRDEIVRQVEAKDIGLVGLLNCAVMGLDGVKLVLIFTSPALLERAESYREKIADIAEKAIGFKPDVEIVLKQKKVRL